MTPLSNDNYNKLAEIKQKVEAKRALGKSFKAIRQQLEKEGYLKTEIDIAINAAYADEHKSTYGHWRNDGINWLSVTLTIVSLIFAFTGC